MTDDDPEIPTTETIEQTETGYRLSIKSKRGRSTNDRDTVEATLKTKERPDEKLIDEVRADVTSTINMLRFNQPDVEDDDD